MSLLCTGVCAFLVQEFVPGFVIWAALLRKHIQFPDTLVQSHSCVTPGSEYETLSSELIGTYNCFCTKTHRYTHIVYI